MKWFAFGLGAALVPFLLSWATDVGGIAVGALSVALLALVPLAVGIAILRYRLYEIDRIISRTIGLALVTGLLIAVFASSVVALQAALTGFTQGQTLAVAASTLVAFSLFQPVRHRVQRAVDRRFDRARYNGERTAAAFADQLRDEVDLPSLQRQLAGVVGTAVRPDGVAIWLRDATR